MRNLLLGGTLISPSLSPTHTAHTYTIAQQKHTCVFTYMCVLCCDLCVCLFVGLSFCMHACMHATCVSLHVFVCIHASISHSVYILVLHGSTLSLLPLADKEMPAMQRFDGCWGHTHQDMTCWRAGRDEHTQQGHFCGKEVGLPRRARRRRRSIYVL